MTMIRAFLFGGGIFLSAMATGPSPVQALSFAGGPAGTVLRHEDAARRGGAGPIFLLAAASSGRYRPVNPRRGFDAHARWCMARYRTYDPATNRYIAEGGFRRICRSPAR